MRRLSPENIAAFISARAGRLSEKDSVHWVHGAGQIRGSDVTETVHFCGECCAAKVAELEERFPEECERVGVCVDGGWGSEEDGAPFCETCGARLSASPTDCAIDGEVDHFTANPPRTPVCWAELEWVMENVSGDHIEASVYGVGSDAIPSIERWREFARIVRRAQKAKR